MKLGLALALLLAACGTARAAVTPFVGAGDPHIQSVVYNPAQVVTLRLAPGFVAMIVLSPDERIDNIAVGDTNAWQVSPNKRGDHVFIKPLQPGSTTNLEVVTADRHYSFLLTTTSDGDPDALYQLNVLYPGEDGRVSAGLASALGAPAPSFPVFHPQGGGLPGSGPQSPTLAGAPSPLPLGLANPEAFSGPAAIRPNAGPGQSPAAGLSPIGAPVDPPAAPGAYRMGGSPLLRPLSITDDGRRTTLVWAKDATLPAVYVVDPQGRETLTDIRIVPGSAGEVMTLDRIWPRYVFKLGRAEAQARRVPMSEARP